MHVAIIIVSNRNLLVKNMFTKVSSLIALNRTIVVPIFRCLDTRAAAKT